MRRTRMWLMLVAIALVACDRRSETSNDGSETAVPATAPATRPVLFLNINGRSVEFPSAKITITKTGAGLDAILCNDDPLSGLDTTNSFMFEMKLDVEKTEDLPSIAWTFEAPDEQPQDSTTGIVLAGGREQLQPVDVKVTFQKAGDDILATIAGKFVSFDPQDSNAPSKIVDVNGTIDASVQEQN